MVVMYFCYGVVIFFFFKQKTAYDLRISDWSSTCALPILVLRLFKPARSTHSSSVPAGHHLRIFLAPSGRFCTRLWASRRGLSGVLEGFAQHAPHSPCSWSKLR